jgi:Caspase domain
VPTESRRLALVIASSQFHDPTLQQLQAPGQDAAALARVLSDPAIGGFEVQELIDRPSHDVRLEIARFFADRKRDDLVLLYFSGHGLKTDDGKLYLATIDTQRRLPLATTVEASFVNEIMSASASRRQVLILDCCHSGAFASGMVAKGGGSADIKERFEGQGRVVLTASNAIQYAFEGDKLTGEAARSVFTRYLVRGLETGDADLDGDGHVALTELYDYVYARVVDETPKQLPGMWALKIEGTLYVARSPKGARAVGTEDARLAEQYRRGMEALSAGRWEEAADWLGKLADERPDYLDVADRVQPLRDLAARMASLGPADRGWRWAVSRWPIVAMLVAGIIPNALASLFNFVYNYFALIKEEGVEREFFFTATAVNFIGFPVGFAAFIWLARPVARGLRRLRAGEELAVEELKPLRDRCLRLGHFAAGLGSALWAIAGPIYPIALDLPWEKTVYFIVSLVLGGLLAAAYPFFAVTFLSVRVVYPALVRPGSTRTDDRVRLERLDNSTWWYLLLAGSVPTVVISVALWGTVKDEHKLLPVLGLSSFTALALAFWVCRVLQRDLAVLKQLVTRSRAGKG